MPGREEIRAVVAELVAASLARKKVSVKPGDVVEGKSFVRDLGIDSLDVLQLMASAEKKFGVRVPEDELKKIDDLGAAVRALEARLSA